MKIRRITAPDMRLAIRRVREELGMDAVILSNKRTEEGVEIIAALDVEAALEQAVNTAAEAKPAVAPSHADSPPPPRRETRPAGLDLWEDEPLDASLLAGADSLGDVAAPAQPGPKVGLPSQAMEESSLPDPYALDRQRAGVKSPPSEAEVARTDRLEEEVRHLRRLMESQLRVLEWRRFARHHPLQSELMRRLVHLGLAPRLAREVVDALGEDALGEHGWNSALRSLGARIPVMDEDLTESGGMFALVGATGVGKTTTVAKLAARFVMRHGRKDIALVSTDHYRIGAYDQLRSYARILDVPLYVAEDAAALAHTLDGLADRRLVLVDTAGMSQRDTRLLEQMRSLRSASSRLQSLLVLSANAQHAMTREAIERFGPLHPAGCVLTKLDEAARLGDALTAVIDAELPVAWLGTGQRVPEDLVTARAERLLARAVEMMPAHEEEDMAEERMSWGWREVAEHG